MAFGCPKWSKKTKKATYLSDFSRALKINDFLVKKHPKIIKKVHEKEARKQRYLEEAKHDETL